MSNLNINLENIRPFFSWKELDSLEPEIHRIQKQMEQGTGKGSEYLGWLRLPARTSCSLLQDIVRKAQYIRENADIFISIGIGGSYLGARAAIDFVNHSFHNQLPPEQRKTPEIYFAGQNLSSDYLSDLIEIIGKKSVCFNVISKSGTTTEPALAFRILKALLEKRYGRKEAGKRIIVTTDAEKGALKKMAEEEGYFAFTIPRDIGGRYSVLTPVGLLPVAVAGIDIKELIKGAQEAEENTLLPGFKDNPAYIYAAVRNLLYRKGKSIEVFASFHPCLHYLAEWWKQLSGESEGKEGKGIFPAAVDFTTDLHSLGQWIQEGRRIIFETFLVVARSNREIKIPCFENNLDGLNYLAGKSLDYINDKAYQGTAAAHREGGVPNMTITLKNRSPQTLGEFFYFFEKAIAVSGYLSGINPFDQPGVEYYKQNMFAILGKQ